MRTTAKTMGMRLKNLREGKGYSQEEAAKLAGIIQVTYSRYENDKIKYPLTEIVEKLATLYGVTVDYLIGAEDGLAHLPKEIRDFLIYICNNRRSIIIFVLKIFIQISIDTSCD
jgi:transcriptional regulator with XRE-family HTH domain